MRAKRGLLSIFGQDTQERAEELSRAGMENNAARKPERSAMAILKSALAKQ